MTKHQGLNIFAKIGWLAVAAVLISGCARKLPPAANVQESNVKALQTAFSGASETAVTAAVVAEPTGWATLKGTFKLNGAPPPPTPLSITKDDDVCAPGGKQVVSEELLVDSNGGIKDVVIYLTGPTKFPVGDPKWEHSDYAAKANAMLDFDQKYCVFLTPMFAMRSKQKAKILNSDSVAHNTNIQGGNRAVSINPMIPENSNATYEPGGESSEPFGVSCSIHPWMSAKMIVRDSPYFAVTKPDGSFEIANVPAGVPLEFRVWQAKAKFLQDVNIGGKAEKWGKGRMKITLQPGEEKELKVVVDAGVFK